MRTRRPTPTRRGRQRARAATCARPPGRRRTTQLRRRSRPHPGSTRGIQEPDAEAEHGAARQQAGHRIGDNGGGVDGVKHRRRPGDDPPARGVGQGRRRVRARRRHRSAAGRSPACARRCIVGVDAEVGEKVGGELVACPRHHRSHHRLDSVTRDGRERQVDVQGDVDGQVRAAAGQILEQVRAVCSAPLGRAWRRPVFEDWLRASNVVTVCGYPRGRLT
jgi:hypothetical protein